MKPRLLVCLASLFVSAGYAASAANLPAKKTPQKPKVQQQGGNWNSGLTDMMNQLENQLAPGKTTPPPEPERLDKEIPPVPGSNEKAATSESSAQTVTKGSGTPGDQIETLKADSYFSEEAKLGLARWERSLMPLKIYIEPASKAKGFRPEFPDVLKQAFDEWAQVVPQAIKLEFVPSPAGATIVCTWTDRKEDILIPGEGGHTELQHSPSGLVHANMKIFTVPKADSGTDTMPIQYMHRIALHEVGHALGLAAHSDEQNDIMYKSAVPQDVESNLSQRDKNTLLVIYSKESIASERLEASKSDMTKLSSDPRIKAMQLNNEAATALNENRYDVARQKLEDAHKLDPSNKMVMGNLGALYANIGSLQAMTMNVQLATINLKQAIPLLEKGGNKTALKQALSNYAKVLRMSNKAAEAKLIEDKIKALGSM